jgi:hypothetical protein
VKITFREKSEDRRATFRVAFARERVFFVMKSDEVPGNFQIAIPETRFPVSEPLGLPDGPEDVVRLNDIGEYELILDGEPWSFRELVIEEMRLDDDVLTARFTGVLFNPDDFVNPLLDTPPEPIEISIHERVQLSGLARTPKLPTSSAPTREDTFDLTIGLGKIRWTDDEATIRALFPDALEIPSMRPGVNPATGEPLVVPGRLHVPAFLEPWAGFHLDAQVGFDERGIVGLGLSTDYRVRPEAGPSPVRRTSEWFESKLRIGPIQVEKVVIRARRIGEIEIPASELERVDQTWKLGTVEVSVRGEYSRHAEKIMLNVRRR